MTAWRAIARAEAQTTPVDSPAVTVTNSVGVDVLVPAELVPVDELPRHRFGA